MRFITDNRYNFLKTSPALTYSILPQNKNAHSLSNAFSKSFTISFLKKSQNVYDIYFSLSIY